MGDKANKIRARARNHWTSNHGPFYVCDGGGGVEREGEGSGVGFGQCQGGVALDNYLEKKIKNHT